MTQRQFAIDSQSRGMLLARAQPLVFAKAVSGQTRQRRVVATRRTDPRFTARRERTLGVEEARHSFG
jgi:hypothetical protein